MSSSSDRVPILFLTDSFDLQTGLARIGRDLATRVHNHLGDKFRVGALGRGGMGGDFPFPTYVIPYQAVGAQQWGAAVLPVIWDRFSQGQPGIVFTIWDPARMLWLSKPEYLEPGAIKDYLTDRPFRLWGYFPIDGHTPNGTLGRMGNESLAGYDRVLAYTSYGSRICENILGLPSVEHLPHGLDPVWRPHDKSKARTFLGIPKDKFMVGVVAANQIRKDWGLAAQVGAKLAFTFGGKYYQWWHSNHSLESHWDHHALLDEFALGPFTMLSDNQQDDWMSLAYSACDVTLAIGAGEGFCYPILESQACGTPVVHVDYAGGAEFTPYKIPFDSYRLEGPLNIMRPVQDAVAWVAKAQYAAKKRDLFDTINLEWDNLWPQWEQWFEEGYQHLCT